MATVLIYLLVVSILIISLLRINYKNIENFEDPFKGIDDIFKGIRIPPIDEIFKGVLDDIFNQTELKRITLITIPESKNISELSPFMTRVFSEILRKFNKEYKTDYVLEQIGIVRLLNTGEFKFNANLIDRATFLSISVVVTVAPDATRVTSISNNEAISQTKPGYTPACPAPFEILPADSIIVTSELERIYTEDLRKLSEKTYLCFGIDENNITTEKECSELSGMWDTAVTDDNDCPYFKSNRNYTNTRGNSKNGYCELPSGLLNLGFRGVVKDPDNSVALCYNCTDNLIGQGTLGRCCESQKFDQRFDGPDYKFPGDSLDRSAAVSEFNLRNLSTT
jgi:hypothetical protein